jgi:hypothetical protein
MFLVVPDAESLSTRDCAIVGVPIRRDDRQCADPEHLAQIGVKSARPIHDVFATHQRSRIRRIGTRQAK